MCVPAALDAIGKAVSRRELFKIAGTAAVGAMAARAGVTLVAPERVQARTMRFSQVMDLTHVLDSKFPVFPIFKPFQMTDNTPPDFAKNGVYTNSWTTPEHVGTHMDAPIHFGRKTANARSMDRIPSARLIAQAAVIHIHERAARNPDAAVTLKDVRDYERRHGRIPQGAVVFMHSGWEARVGDSKAFFNADAKGTAHFPGFLHEATDFLMKERNVAGIGVDTLSLDPGNSPDFKVHFTWLGAANKFGIENVANLAAIPPAGATVFIGALKVRAASGGPLRLLAVW